MCEWETLREKGGGDGEDPLPIFLPQTRLAQILGVKQPAISSITQLLVLHGVLQEVSPRWSYAQKKAKEYHCRFDPRSYTRAAPAS